MKLLSLLLAAAGLTGCAGYGYPYAGGAGYYGQVPYYGQGAVYPQPYVVDPSITIYGGTRYRAPAPTYTPHGRGDRDRDGIPNRVDRDSDGDGVPNWQDRRPMDPRRI